MYLTIFTEYILWVRECPGEKEMQYLRSLLRLDFYVLFFHLPPHQQNEVVVSVLPIYGPWTVLHTTF